MRSGIKKGSVAKVRIELRKLIPKMENALQRALYHWGELIYIDSKANVPVEYANLRDSLYIASRIGGRYTTRIHQRAKPTVVRKLQCNNPIVVSGSRALARSYKSPFVIVGHAAYYSVYVHENLGMSHPRGGNALFLREAMQNTQALGFANLQKEVKVVF